MTPQQRSNLVGWLQYCEANPGLWAKPGGIEIPLAQVGMTYDEVAGLFERPTLAEVRQAVEEWLAAEAEERKDGSE